MALHTLYHGSNAVVEQPLHDKGRVDTDFGVGFYTSSELSMVEKWACRKQPAIINEYRINTDELKIYKFNSDREWLDFVIGNRQMRTMQDSNYAEYDVLIGPTADDKLFSTIEQYENGYITAETACKVLDCMKVGEQVVLKTQKAINSLIFVQAYELSKSKTESTRVVINEERKEAEMLTQTIIREAVAGK